ncbi:hypothetical protein ACFWPQ_07205 [Streptomyces sp. NPDC058464]|uniref:hypothetical protein n=1 Tax=Streptomyces sp. NPDC058464 TaxID=3346511 RepID=UPI0036630F1F
MDDGLPGPVRYEQAAALLHGLAGNTPWSTATAGNHPLVDGNKRTVWPATATFLAVSGVDRADVAQDTAYDLVVDVASGAESGVGVIARRLRDL